MLHILLTTVDPYWKNRRKTRNWQNEILMAPKDSPVDRFISRGIIAYRTKSRKISSNCHGDYQCLSLGMIPEEEPLISHMYEEVRTLLQIKAKMIIITAHYTSMNKWTFIQMLDCLRSKISATMILELIEFLIDANLNPYTKVCRLIHM